MQRSTQIIKLGSLTQITNLILPFNSRTEDEFFYFYVDFYENPDKRAPFEDSKEDEPETDLKVA